MSVYGDSKAPSRQGTMFRRRATSKNPDDSESESPYKSSRTLVRAGSRLAPSSNIQNFNPTQDMANVRVRQQGFRVGRYDSTASNVKVRRGMRVEEIDKEEFVEMENTAEITDIDYDEPDSKQFETQIKRHEYELLGKDFADGLAFYT